MGYGDGHLIFIRFLILNTRTGTNSSNRCNAPSFLDSIWPNKHSLSPDYAENFKEWVRKWKRNVGTYTNLNILFKQKDSTVLPKILFLELLVFGHLDLNPCCCGIGMQQVLSSFSSSEKSGGSNTTILAILIDAHLV